MNSGKFSWRREGGVEYLSCSELLSKGIEHGFIGKSADFSAAGREVSERKLRDHFGVSKVVLLNQVHGAHIADCQAGDFAADGILIPRKKANAERTAYGLVVADCLAIFLISDEAICLVHAGWRGLSQGIHEKGLERLRAVSGSSKIDAVVWPCAGHDSYEVGPEVISALGPAAVFTPGAGERSYLGIRETVAKSFSAASACDLIYISEECTISNPAFHSYRRDGRAAGRNLAFVIL